MPTAGKEAEYLGDSRKMFSPLEGITDDDRSEFLRTYGNPDGMRAGFRHYAAMLDDGKANRAAFDRELTMPVLVLNAGLGIPQEQTLGGVEQVFASVEHDKVLLAGHAFAVDRPDWAAARIIRFSDPAGDKAAEGPRRAGIGKATSAVSKASGNQVSCPDRDPVTDDVSL